MKTIKATAEQVQLFLTGECELRATVGEKGPPKLYLHAYTGNLMKLPGWDYPVVVDLSTAAFDKAVTPVIQDHKTSMRVGHTTEQVIIKAGQTQTIGGRQVVGPAIAATGLASSRSATAKRYIRDAKSGYPFQVSIGATKFARQFVPAGQTATVNAQSFPGPFYIARNARIRELSVTVLGADSDTFTEIAAKDATLTENQMDEELKAFIESLGLDPDKIEATQLAKIEAKHAEIKAATTVINPPAKKTKKVTKKAPIKAAVIDDDDEDDVDEIAAKAADEAERVDSIKEICASYDEFEGEVAVAGLTKKLTVKALKAHAIRHRWSPEQVELTMLRAGGPTGASLPAIHSKTNDKEGNVIEAYLCRVGGMPESRVNRISDQETGLKAYFKEDVLEKSHEKKYREIGNRISGLLNVQIRAAGKYCESHDPMAMLHAAHDAWETLGGHSIQASGFSTISVTNILENTMNKMAVASYNSVENVWSYFSAKKSVNDFRPHNLYRLDANGHFRQVATDGELKHISMSDTKKTYGIDTYGAMMTIDRKTMKNDDLGLILDQARAIGLLGAQCIEKVFFTTLLANTGSFYASGNGNILTGGTSPLSLSSLTLADAKFRNQVVNGSPVGISPTRLLVGVTLKQTADNIWSEKTLAATGDTDALVFTKNPHYQLYRPYTSPYMDNSAAKGLNGATISNQSATRWFLFADPDLPQGASMIAAFLDGRQTPYYDEAETQFNIPGGIQLRSYFDFGFDYAFPELSLMSDGA